MAYYIFTLVRAVDQEGKPLPENSLKAGLKEIRQLNVWDERTHACLMADYKRDQFVTVTRLGHQHTAGRPLERKGELTVAAPFLVSIEDDTKHNMKQSDGPKDFLPRPERSE